MTGMSHRQGEFRPSKALGQNFLVDPNLIRKLVASIDPVPPVRVLEIGPGRGALTAPLLEAGCQVTAVEKDLRLAEGLEERFKDWPDFRLIRGDALKVDLEEPGGEGPLRLLSNLPYSVTSPLLLKIVFSGLPFDRIVVTIQREVARRIVASSGREYGRLSVLIALYGKARKLFDLPGEAFRPRPRVVSTALQIEPARDGPALVRGSFLEGVVKAAFSERRKQMAKLVAGATKLERDTVEALLLECGIPARARAEEVSPAQFVELARRLERRLSGRP